MVHIPQYLLRCLWTIDLYVYRVSEAMVMG